jgi:NitT/TauT family transport system ATP-binding protein
VTATHPERQNDDRADASVLSLRLKGLSFDAAPVLGAINLTVRTGETLALVGPSGIGKSSLLRVIAGLEKGYQGNCDVIGKVAMVFQEPTLLPWRNVRDNITVTTGVSSDIAENALHEVGLQGRGDDYPLKLSLGQQRRLSLARAFAVRPALLLMDEPFVSLDPSLVAEMMTLFRTLRDTHKVATIIVTHVEEEARALADRVVTLAGSPAAIV